MPHYVVQIAPAKGVSKDTLLEILALGGDRNPGDAGFNLPALRGEEIIESNVKSHQWHLGIRVRVRRKIQNTFVDWPWFLLPRSSTASKTPLRLANSMGIMDAGYRGEVVAIVDNVSDARKTFSSGRPYFQMVLPDAAPMEDPYVKIVVVADFPVTQRGSGGLGSTDRDQGC